MNGYDDIINLPHHVSPKHPQMSMPGRAAQFSPFAALTGYDAAIEESARQTERRMELGEDAKAELSEKLRYLKVMEAEHPEAAFTYFIPDTRKEGGRYDTLTARVKRIDEFKQEVILTDGRSIPMGDLLEVDCEHAGTPDGYSPPDGTY